MNNHALLFSGVESRKNYNIAIAKEALLFARSIIPIEGSFTHPTIKDPALINKLYKQIKQNRAFIPTLFESLYFLLVKWNNFEKIYSKIAMRPSKFNHVENCGVLSEFAAAFLKKKNIASVEIVEIKNSDHTFVIIDRAQASGANINNVNTWGDRCIILDVLNNEIYDRSELYQKLKCYRFNKKSDNPHVLTPFSQTDELTITKSFICSVSPKKNQEIFNKFLQKLNIIFDVLEDYSDNGDDIKQLMQKIKSYKCETYDLVANTNFALERLLDKKIRMIVREMDNLALLDKEKLYLNLIINLSSLYQTACQYFFDLIRLETPLLYFVSHIKEYEGGNIDKLNTVLRDQSNLKKFLSYAMNDSNALSVEVLMQYGADPTCKNLKGDSVLIWAIKKKKINIIEFLLDHHDYLFTKSGKDNFLPIHEIAYYGFYKAVSLILNKFPYLVSSQVDDGSTPLHLVVVEGHFQTFVELLKCGADQTIPDQNGILPIHITAMNGRIEMLQVMLDFNPELINCQDTIELKTLLHLAAENGHISIVEELLKRGADTKFVDRDGFQPMQLAVKKGHADIVKMIMDHGVVVDEALNMTSVKGEEESVLQTEKDKKRKEKIETPSLELPSIKKPRF